MFRKCQILSHSRKVKKRDNVFSLNVEMEISEIKWRQKVRLLLEPVEDVYDGAVKEIIQDPNGQLLCVVGSQFLSFCILPERIDTIRKSELLLLPCKTLCFENPRTGCRERSPFEVVSAKFGRRKLSLYVFANHLKPQPDGENQTLDFGTLAAFSYFDLNSILDFPVFTKEISEHPDCINSMCRSVDWGILGHDCYCSVLFASGRFAFIRNLPHVQENSWPRDEECAQIIKDRRGIDPLNVQIFDGLVEMDNDWLQHKVVCTSPITVSLLVSESGSVVLYGYVPSSSEDRVEAASSSGCILEQFDDIEKYGPFADIKILKSKLNAFIIDAFSLSRKTRVQRKLHIAFLKTLYNLKSLDGPNFFSDQNLHKSHLTAVGEESTSKESSPHPITAPNSSIQKKKYRPAYAKEQNRVSLPSVSTDILHIRAADLYQWMVSVNANILVRFPLIYRDKNKVTQEGESRIRNLGEEVSTQEEYVKKRCRAIYQRFQMIFEKQARLSERSNKLLAEIHTERLSNDFHHMLDILRLAVEESVALLQINQTIPPSDSLLAKTITSKIQFINGRERRVL